MAMRIHRILILIASFVLFQLPPLSTAEPGIPHVGPIGITVADLDRSVGFYDRVLSFKKIDETEFHKDAFDRLTGVFGARVRVATMKLGNETIELTEYLTPPGRPIPLDSRSNDRWFQHIAVVVRDMDKAYDRLNQFGVKPISTEPQRIPDWNQAAAGIRAYYFRDPDNHALELIYFPPGKGDPRWQRAGEDLFLGVDHTAIAVWDTDRSIRLYRDELGLRVAGESVNYGVEQERLNHVFGSRVRITGLRAAGGPGIEFLEYLAPRDGRPYPADARPNDLIHWQVAIEREGVSELFEHLVSNKVTLISPAFVDLGTLGLRGSKAILVRDPDGHALKLVEP